MGSTIHYYLNWWGNLNSEVLEVFNFTHFYYITILKLSQIKKSPGCISRCGRNVIARSVLCDEAISAPVMGRLLRRKRSQWHGYRMFLSRSVLCDEAISSVHRGRLLRKRRSQWHGHRLFLSSATKNLESARKRFFAIAQNDIKVIFRLTVRP